MFTQLALLSYRRRRLILGGWVILVVALLAAANFAGGVFKTEFKLPGSESQQAVDILKDKGFSARAGVESQIVFASDQGVDDPAVRQAMEGLFTGSSRRSPTSTS